MRRILVTGGRAFGCMPVAYDACDEARLRRRAMHERDFFNMKIDIVLNVSEENMLGDYCVFIHGGAKGADTLAEDYAIVSWKQTQIFPADWKKHGKPAGVIRNQQMLQVSKPEEVVAFPGNTGTDHMVRIARAAGVPVTQFFTADVDAYIASLATTA